MNKLVKERFEAVTLPAFGIQDGSPVNEKGEYKSPIEDHWQTFQEGWEACLDECCSILLEMHDHAKGNHNFYLHASLELKRKIM